MKTPIEIIDEMLYSYRDGYGEKWEIEVQILQDLRERIEKECGWISVKERLPTPWYDEVICYVQEYDNIMMGHYSTDGDWGSSIFFFWDVTHWMPRPLYPKK